MLPSYSPNNHSSALSEPELTSGEDSDYHRYYTTAYSGTAESEHEVRRRLNDEDCSIFGTEDSPFSADEALGSPTHHRDNGSRGWASTKDARARLPLRHTAQVCPFDLDEPLVQEVLTDPKLLDLLPEPLMQLSHYFAKLCNEMDQEHHAEMVKASSGGLKAETATPASIPAHLNPEALKLPEERCHTVASLMLRVPRKPSIEFRLSFQRFRFRCAGLLFSLEIDGSPQETQRMALNALAKVNPEHRLLYSDQIISNSGIYGFSNRADLIEKACGIHSEKATGALNTLPHSDKTAVRKHFGDEYLWQLISVNGSVGASGDETENKPSTPTPKKGNRRRARSHSSRLFSSTSRNPEARGPTKLFRKRSLSTKTHSEVSSSIRSSEDISDVGDADISSSVPPTPHKRPRSASTHSRRTAKSKSKKASAVTSKRPSRKPKRKKRRPISLTETVSKERARQQQIGRAIRNHQNQTLGSKRQSNPKTRIASPIGPQPSVAVAGGGLIRQVAFISRGRAQRDAIFSRVHKYAVNRFGLKPVKAGRTTIELSVVVSPYGLREAEIQDSQSSHGSHADQSGDTQLFGGTSPDFPSSALSRARDMVSDPTPLQATLAPLPAAQRNLPPVADKLDPAPGSPSILPATDFATTSIPEDEEGATRSHATPDRPQPVRNLPGLPRIRHAQSPNRSVPGDKSIWQRLMTTSDKSIAAEILALHLHEIMSDPRYRVRLIPCTGEKESPCKTSPIDGPPKSGMAERESEVGTGSRGEDEGGDGTVFSVVSVLDMDGTIQPKNNLTGNTTDNNLSNSAAVGPIKALLAAGTVVAVNSGNRALLQIRRILAGFGPGELWMLERMIICVQGGSIAYRLVPVIVEKENPSPSSNLTSSNAAPFEEILREVYVDVVEIPEWSRWLRDLPRDRKRRQQELLEPEQEWLFDADDEIETETENPNGEHPILSRTQSHGDPRSTRGRTGDSVTSDEPRRSGVVGGGPDSGTCHDQQLDKVRHGQIHTDSHVKYDRPQKHPKRSRSASLKPRKPRRRRRRHTLLLVADDELAGNEAKVEGAISIHVGAVQPDQVARHPFHLPPYPEPRTHGDRTSTAALSHHLSHSIHLNHPHQEPEIDGSSPVVHRNAPAFPDHLHDRFLHHRISSPSSAALGSDPNTSPTGVSSVADDELEEEDGGQNSFQFHCSSQETDTTLRQSRTPLIHRAQSASSKTSRRPRILRLHSAMPATENPHCRNSRHSLRSTHQSQTSSSQASDFTQASRRKSHSATGRSRHRRPYPSFPSAVVGPPEVRIVTDSAGLSWIQSDRPQDEGLSQALTSLHRFVRLQLLDTPAYTRDPPRMAADRLRKLIARDMWVQSKRRRRKHYLQSRDVVSTQQLNATLRMQPVDGFEPFPTASTQSNQGPIQVESAFLRSSYPEGPLPELSTELPQPSSPLAEAESDSKGSIPGRVRKKDNSAGFRRGAPCVDPKQFGLSAESSQPGKNGLETEAKSADASPSCLIRLLTATPIKSSRCLPQRTVRKSQAPSPRHSEHGSGTSGSEGKTRVNHPLRLPEPKQRLSIPEVPSSSSGDPMGQLFPAKP